MGLVAHPPAGMSLLIAPEGQLSAGAWQEEGEGRAGHGRGAGRWELIAHDEEKRAAWMHLNRRCGVEGKEGRCIASGKDVI